MPHLLLEYTNNIDFHPGSSTLLHDIHLLLAEELPTDLSSCKSRCIAHDLYYVGDGSKNNAFIHLTIKVLSGRSDEKKRFIAEEILGLLNEYFSEYKNILSLQLSVELLDLDKNYFK